LDINAIDSRAVDLFFRWESLNKAGQVVSPEELCRNSPELLAAVRCLISQVRDFSASSSGDQSGAVSLHVISHRAGQSPGLPDDPKFSERYEILSEIGRGGMGVVYRPRHKALDKQVAVKVMLPDAASERFVREARLLAKIKSPYVVTVHDFEVLTSGSPILVMEWVDGTNLRLLIQAEKGPLAEDKVVPWMRHTCEGMLVAAQQGIVHRDLKPSNLLINTEGCAQVADFGLARTRTSLSDLSKTDVVMGAPHYMAPEQAEDPRGVDTRADVYSFGATFYHALTGRPPFEGATAFSILYQHKTEPLISPRARRPALSERTSEIVERCLAKAPTDRFSSFAEILKHLNPTISLLGPWTASEDTELVPYLARYRSRKVIYFGGTGARNSDLDVYAFPRGQRLRIIRGDIVSQDVDAVVSSDTCHLRMEWGVSAAIRQAAGETVAVEAMQHAPIRAGRAVVTAGGRLTARLIFHGVTIGFVNDLLVTPSRDLISEIMTSCFYHADSHDVRSIAFPMLGTGAMRFPRELCLDTMFQFLARTLLRGLTCVQDARIVLFHEDS
jgi:serine/threonine protein kinase